MKLPLTDIVIVILYLVGVVFFGAYFVRKSRTTEGFMAAGRSLPGWAVGMSILGTYVSSISFLALPGKAYGGNWNAFVFSLSLPLAAWIAVKYFVPYYRKSKEVSAYSHLEHRFGPWARTYAMVMYLLTQLARMGTIIYLVALTISPLTGVNIVIIILVTGILVTFYTLLGGIEAVIWTDVVQTAVLILGAVICLGVMLFGMPEHPWQVIQIAMENHKFSLGSFDMRFDSATFWVVLSYGLVINLQNFGIDQSYIQRYFTAKSDKDAKRSVWLGALVYIPVSAVFFFIGTALFSFYKSQPMLMHTMLQSATKPDAVFPHFIVTQLPTGMVGLLIAAITAAAMSSVDTSLNSSATILLQDIYKRYFRRNAGEKESIRFLHIATLCWGLVGTSVALAMIRAGSVLDAWWQLAGIFGGGMLGLFLLGMISRKAGNPAAVTGVILGIAVILWMTFSPSLHGQLAWLKSPFNNLMVIVIGTLTILFTGILLSALKKRKMN